jgi:hypothetical protein
VRSASKSMVDGTIRGFDSVNREEHLFGDYLRVPGPMVERQLLKDYGRVPNTGRISRFQ